ncbi:MAG: Gfo/Idh/MocA family protein [bacterium]
MTSASAHTVGVGIIGLGFMGRTHLASYVRTAGCEVRALLDPAQRAAPAGNLITTGDDVDRLIASLARMPDLAALLARDDIHLISICTPTDTHVSLVRAAIAAGKHVLVEKPTALDAREIDTLDREARAAGVRAMPAHCMRFWPAWAWMADAVRTRRFGAVRRAHFRRLGAAPGWSQDFYLDFKRSGGAIVDLHMHDADFVRFVFGEPSSVEATGSRRHVRTRYGFADNVIVEAEGGWMEDPSFAFTMTAEVVCERATIEFDLSRSPELRVVSSADGVVTELVAGRDYPAGNGYDHEIAALVAAIRDGRPTPVTLADAAATQRLLDREIAAISA